MLNYYDVTKPILIQCDSSPYAVGAAILQDTKPIEYASHTMTRLESDSYAQIEKTIACSGSALERFDLYVYGRRITEETGHKPLITIAKKVLATAPKRLQRMLLRLQRYDFDLIYRPGQQILITDTLSRICADVTDRLDASSRFCEELKA